MRCMIVGKVLMISPEAQRDVEHLKMMIHNRGGWKINIKTADVGDERVPTALLLEPGDDPKIAGDGVTDEEKAENQIKDFTKGDEQGNVFIPPRSETRRI